MRANATDGKLFFNVKFTKAKEINLYMYKGDSRRRMKQSVIEENKQAEVDKVYQFSIEEKILLIAFPNLNKDTEFSFNYWISAYKEPVKDEWYEFAGTTGEDVFMVLCGIAVVLLGCIVCVCCYCCTINARNLHAKRVEA